MEESQPQLQPHVTDCRNDRVIGKIRDTLLSQASTLNSSVIERRIQELFNSFNTPTHPPYALMIQRALTELDEENGSTEEAISEFIKKEFNDLPWAHTRILGLHLRKLSRAEELLCTESGRYMLMVDSGDFGERKESGWRASKRSKRSRRRRNHRGGKRNKTLERNEGTERDNGLQEEEIEEENQLSDLHGTGTNEMIEERGKSEIWLLGMSEGRHGRATQAQNEAKEPQNKSMDELIQEAIMELNEKIGSSDIVNTEPLMAKEQQDMVIEKHIQFEKQSNELLAVAENQTPIRQLEVTTEISRFSSDEKSKDENLSTLFGGPTVAVIPKDNLQTLGQEGEHQQNETPEPQKLSDACKLLVDQEDPIFHLETTCSSRPTARDHPVDPTSNFWKHPMVPVSTKSTEHIPSVESDLTLAQLELQISKYGPSESDFCAASKMSDSLSYMNVHEHNQLQDWIQGSPRGRLDDKTTFGDPEQQPPKSRHSGRLPNKKPVADYPVESFMPSDDGILNEQKLENYKIKKQRQLQPQDRGRGRGRSQGRSRGRSRGRGRGSGSSPPLDSNPHKHKEQIQLQDQSLDPVTFPYFEPKVAVHSSQPAPNPPVVVTPNHQQQLGNPISEGNPGCMPSTEREISPIQLQLQMSWHRLIGRDLGTTFKMETSLFSMNVYEDKPRQHGNKRSPRQKLDLDDETAFGNPGQQPPKCRRRGRPPNPEPVEDCSQVSFLPTNNGIHDEENPNFDNIVTQRQMQARGCGRSRGRGQGRGRGRSRGRGRWRLPKLDHNEHHCELWPQDQAQGLVHSPNVPDEDNQSWEQKQWQLQSRAETQGRHHKLDSTVDGSCQNPLLLPQGSSRGWGRRGLQKLKTPEGLGSSLQPMPNVRQSYQQLQLESCQGQGRRLLRSSSTLRQGS